MTEKARITPLLIGKIQINGLMLPSGEFGILTSQIASLFSIPPHNSTRTFKRLLGKKSGFLQVKVIEHQTKKAMGYVTLSEFETIVAKLDRAGNKEAQLFRDSLVGLSLTQLWSDAFGVKFEKQQRLEYLEARQEHRQRFHVSLTPYWKKDGCVGEDYMHRVIEFKEVCSLPTLKSVNDYNETELRILNIQEIKYQTLRDIGVSHEDALKHIRI